MSGPYPKITYNVESDRFYYDWHGVIRPATEQEIAGAMERLSAFEHEHDALLRGRIPTHRCKICGALWIFWPAGAAGMTEASWSLFSLRCYKCCDCAPMGEQIEPLPRLGALSGEPASAHETCGDERILRRLLAFAYSGPGELYGDDGELQNTAGIPVIDFVRDSATEIERKITERGNRKLASAQKASGEPT